MRIWEYMGELIACTKVKIIDKFGKHQYDFEHVNIQKEYNLLDPWWNNRYSGRSLNALMKHLEKDENGSSKMEKR